MLLEIKHPLFYYEHLLDSPDNVEKIKNFAIKERSAYGLELFLKEYAENDETGYWHGVSPFDIETGKPKNNHEGEISWSHLYSDLCEQELEEHQNAILISPATIKGAGLDSIPEKYKKRIINGLVGNCPIGCK